MNSVTAAFAGAESPAIGRYVRSAAPFGRASDSRCVEALEELLRLGEDRPTAVIIDEFPYLVAATPALPSYLQRAPSPLGYAREHTKSRMILCGSALTTMSDLLGSGAPLRERARLELILRPFGYREAAGFWGVADVPELAFQLHALVGGTPAYKDMCGGVGPRTLAEFDGWVRRRLLNPASAMFREVRDRGRARPAWQRDRAPAHRPCRHRADRARARPAAQRSCRAASQTAALQSLRVYP